MFILKFADQITIFQFHYEFLFSLQFFKTKLKSKIGEKSMFSIVHETDTQRSAAKRRGVFCIDLL